MPVRPEKEIEGLFEYLESALDYIVPLAKTGRLLAVITAGGMEEDGYTEAAKWAEMVGYRRQFECCDFPIEQDPISLSTPSIVESGFALVAEKYRDATLVLICDKPRVVTTWFVAWRTVIRTWFAQRKEGRRGHRLMRFKVMGLARYDTHPNSRWWRQLAKVVLMIFAYEKVKQKSEKGR